MYTSFQIKNFRCFDNLKLDDLARVNLIAGKNNVGKTALLEAIFIYCGSYDLRLLMTVNNMRGIERFKYDLGNSRQTIWDSFFKDFNNKRQIELVGLHSTFKKHIIRLNIITELQELDRIIRMFQPQNEEADGILSNSRVSQIIALEHEDPSKHIDKYYMLLDRQGKLRDLSVPPSFTPAFIFRIGRSEMADDAEKYGNLIRTKQEGLVLDILKKVEPRLLRIEALPVGGISTIHGDIGLSELVPFQLMGDGLNRLASIIINMGNIRDGVLLIDEFENGLHYSVLKEVWKGISEASKVFNVQVFATTHSLECIRAAHEASEENNTYDFRYHRLDRTKSGEIRVVSYDEEVMDAAIEVNSEVR
ncbi:MAG: AAA family ATPase [Anaerolineaceae bacterium]|nr:AAA family ATPase [Anaerolineaceae bacterium]